VKVADVDEAAGDCRRRLWVDLIDFSAPKVRAMVLR
jgi:hypothetical protein